MSTPRSIRFELATLTKPAGYASRHPGMTSSSAAAMLVEEGLRMDAHPGIVFRDGPSGRRAGLSTGPDVWELTRAIREARAAHPRMADSRLLQTVGQDAGVSLHDLQVALGYYGEYREEIDAWMLDADAAEDRAERMLANTRDLLGA